MGILKIERRLAKEHLGGKGVRKASIRMEHLVLSEEVHRALEMAIAQARNTDVIDEATRALLEELADFFPGRRGKALKAMSERIDRLEEMALELTGELGKTLETALAGTGAPFSSSPPSAESGPAPTQ